MSLASSSSVGITYMPEATFGLTPVSGAVRRLRITGETFDYAITKAESAEINSTRTISSVVPVDASATGGISGEISYREWDVLMAATLQSTFSAYGVNSVSATFSSTAGGIAALSITAAVAPTAASAFTNLKKGQWIRVVAPGDTDNNGKIVKLSSTVAPTTTVLTLDAGTPMTLNAGTVALMTVASSRLTHGTTQTSFSIERELPDVSPAQYFAYKGMTPSKMTMQESSGALSSIGFDFMGKNAVRAATTSMLPAVITDSFSHEIHSGVAGATVVIWEGGGPLAGTFVKSLKMDFDNSLRVQNGIGTLGAVGIGSGTIKLTGELEVYLADGALYDKFVNNTNSSIVFSSVDVDGNGYIISLPKINFTTLKTNASGKDQDMMLNISFTALRDNANADVALQKAIFIDRVGTATA